MLFRIPFYLSIIQWAQFMWSKGIQIIMIYNMMLEYFLLV